MSRLNFLVRDPISFVGGPWRATADLVHERVVTMLHRLYICRERSRRLSCIPGLSAPVCAFSLSFPSLCAHCHSILLVDAQMSVCSCRNMKGKVSTAVTSMF